MRRLSHLITGRASVSSTASAYARLTPSTRTLNSGRLTPPPPKSSPPPARFTSRSAAAALAVSAPFCTTSPSPRQGARRPRLGSALFREAWTAPTRPAPLRRGSAPTRACAISAPQPTRPTSGCHSCPARSERRSPSLGGRRRTRRAAQAYEVPGRATTAILCASRRSATRTNGSSSPLPSTTLMLKRVECCAVSSA